MCDICNDDKPKRVIKKVDYFGKVDKILQGLQVSKQYFTKKQLCALLKGKNAFISKRGKQT